MNTKRVKIEGTTHNVVSSSGRGEGRAYLLTNGATLHNVAGWWHVTSNGASIPVVNLRLSGVRG